MKRHIPNLITCLNILTGAAGIVTVAVKQDPSLALPFILLAGVFDFFDGLAARMLRVQSDIGKELDSLADVISFGMLPAAALVIGLSQRITSGIFDFRELPFWALIGLLIVPFSALRLAKFNLATDQSDEFKGLPTPANAILIGAFLYTSLGFVSAGFLIGLTLLSCFLLVSNIPMLAFKFKTMQWQGNEAKYVLLLILLVGLILLQQAFLPFVIPTYILVSIVGNYLVRKGAFREQ